MIYTVGHRASYEQGILETNNQLHKKGPYVTEDKQYDGGSVWQDAAQAEAYLHRHSLADYAVYGLIADWDTDTKQLPNEEWRRLQRDALIVKLD